jgi:hypothetical protein
MMVRSTNHDSGTMPKVHRRCLAFPRLCSRITDCRRYFEETWTRGHDNVCSLSPRPHALTHGHHSNPPSPYEGLKIASQLLMADASLSPHPSIRFEINL